MTELNQTDEEVRKTFELVCALPFVESDPQFGVSMWPDVIEPTGSVDKDIDIGVSRAELTIAHANVHGDPFIIAWVLTEMVRSGRMDHIASGFLVRIAQSAKAGGNH